MHCPENVYCNGSTNIYNCKAKIIHCTCGNQIAPVFKVFDTSSKLFPSCKLSTCSRFVPPLQFCLKFVFQISPPAPNLSKIFPPEWLPCFSFVLNVLTRLVTLICMNLSNRIRSLFPYLSPCSRFVQSFFPRVPLLQILHTSSLSSKCLYIYWKLAFGFVSYLPPAPDSLYL